MSVGPHMLRQNASLSKALATGRTHSGLLTRVGPGMPRQGAGASKPLATRHT